MKTKFLLGRLKSTSGFSRGHLHMKQILSSGFPSNACDLPVVFSQILSFISCRASLSLNKKLFCYTQIVFTVIALAVPFLAD